MLKEIIASLDNDGIKSNSLISQGFDYLIRNTKVYCIYSVKYEMSKEDFHEWFAKEYDYEFFGSYKLKYSFIDIVDRWYEFFLKHGTLTDKTKSLKSDCKRWYKENKDKDLKGFDRFFEAVKRAFEESNGVCDIVFYSVDGLRKNKNFTDDRKSCFLKSRKDYFKVISQMNAFYVVIYRNGKPVNRIWALLSKDKESIVFFNLYGYQIKDYTKLFTSSKDEFDSIRTSELQSKLGIYVNSGNWIINKDGNLDDFIYKVTCPSCGSSVHSSDLYITRTRLHCQCCLYSSYYKKYINGKEAVFSFALDTYIYENDAVYSYYNNDYFPKVNKYTGLKMVSAYNSDRKDFDWVAEKQCVYSSYYGYNLINEQAVYSKYLDSYVDKNDENLVYIEDDYIPKEVAEMLV